MLRADEIDALRDSFIAIAEPVESWLLRDLAARVAQAGALTSTAEYEVWRLQNLGLSQSEIRKKVAQLMGVTGARAEELFRQAAGASYRDDITRLPTLAGIPFEENDAMQRITQAAVKVAGDTLENMTQTLGMVDPFGQPLPLQQVYYSCTNFAFQQVITGATDYVTAVRSATRNLAKYGLQTIDYQSGVRTSLEAAIRRNMMGGLGLMQEQMAEEVFRESGADGWEISAHAMSAPDHESIQGRQYSDADYKALNDSLVRRIGTLNCGHVAFPIILGVSEPQYTKEELEAFRKENAEGVTVGGRKYTLYQATQKQRAIERELRRQKRKVLVAEASGDKDKALPEQIKLQILRQDYKRFSKAAGLKTQDERHEIAGFGHKEAARAEKSADTAYRKWAKEIGAENLIKTLEDYYGLRYNNPPEYELFSRYARDVEAGWLSPLIKYDGYKHLFNRIQSEIVGKSVCLEKDTIVLTSQSEHFMQRVVGTMVDPKKLQEELQVIRRSGVEIEDIKDALFLPKRTGNIITRKDGNRSVKFYGETVAVSINPDTGKLIQVNPLGG